jgi:hypothetical protein
VICMKLPVDILVSAVTAVCLLALAGISKGILNVQLDFVSLYSPVWVYMAYVITRNKKKKSDICCSPLFWSVAVTLVTVAVLVVYVIL